MDIPGAPSAERSSLAAKSIPAFVPRPWKKKPAIDGEIVMVNRVYPLVN
jgi:hypothetical protein